MPKRKVAFLDFSHVFAGAERVLYNMIAHIDREKYEPVLIFPYPEDHQRRYDDLECEKIYLAVGKKWWMGGDRWKNPLKGTDFLKRAEFGRRLARVINKNNIDILDVNLMRVDVQMWVWASRKFTKAKIIGHYRSQDQGWVAPSSGQVLFDVVACVSAFSKMRFQLKGKFVRAEVLYDSVDVDVMKSSLTKSDAKKALGYDDSTRLLISVGQLSKHKGHDTAIKAFAAIANEYPDARLFIAGGGAPDLVKYYRDLAADLGVTDRVSVPGIQLANIQDIYRAADLTLSLTKVGEGFGLVPYESSLIGTPFIAPCFGAVIEFVKDGETGLLVDTNNIDAVVNKVRQALDHPAETAAMVEKLNKIIHEKLRPEVLAQNLDKLYQSI